MSAFEAPPPYDSLPTRPGNAPATTSQSGATRSADYRARYIRQPRPKFKIGSRTTDNTMVQMDWIKGHLTLLHAFMEFRKRVEAFKTENFPALHLPPNMDAEKKWAWIVGLAVERFDVWCQNLKMGDVLLGAEVVLPPIDVLMVWHAYTLNPRWYGEDRLRIDRCKILKIFELHFQRMVVGTIVLPSAPSASRVEFWKRKTNGMHFDVLNAAHYLRQRAIICPVCNNAFNVDLMNEEGTGYLQQGFRTACPLFCLDTECDDVGITKETLALQKFANDVVSPDLHLAGTQYPESQSDTKVGDSIKKKVLNASESSVTALFLYEPGTLKYRQALSTGISRHAKYSMANLRDQLSHIRHQHIVERIMAAYNDDKVYSVELVDAVLRQGSFVKNMFNLGWTSPGYFDGQDNEIVLHHAIARYHAFWDLMASSPSSYFVPTLDIDLVWHTHQLVVNIYTTACSMYLDHFIDHDGKVEASRLSSAFDNTCRAWKDRFHVEYIHCGCPVPDKTIGQRLSSMIGFFDKPPPSNLVPCDRPDVLSATHPSDHNAVCFTAKPGHLHEQAPPKSEPLPKEEPEERETPVLNGQPSSQAQTFPPTGPYGFNIPIPIPVPVPLPIYFGNGMFPPGAGFGAGVGVGGSFAYPFGGCAICGSAGGCDGRAWAAASGCGGAGGSGVGGRP